MKHTKKIFAATALLAIAGGSFADSPAPARGPTPSPGEPTLAEIRLATTRFADVEMAFAAGYVRDPGNLCETADMIGRPTSDGAMGIHFFRPDLLGITAPPNPRVNGTGTHTDFREPGVLIYEPQADGSLALVAVENLVFKAPWEAAGNTEPPTSYGLPYDLMEDDPATDLDKGHMFAPHYDRHVWLHRANPKGVFSQFNPRVTCAHHSQGRHANGS